MWPKFFLFLQRWRGVILIGLAVAATIWLAIGGELLLYIHPRYVIFTVVMAVIALAFVIASAVVRTPGHADEDAADEDAADGGAADGGAANGRGRQLSKALSISAAAFAAALAVSMVALPAVTLTSATAEQRDINSTALGLGSTDVASVNAGSAGAFETFTVGDWASLLRQTSDLGFYADKPVSVSGFIVPDPGDPQNLFYVSRFVVTCCAVDAQPVGVPVYAPNWSASLAIDDWVSVEGEFSTNPSQSSAQPLAIAPESIEPIEQPSAPYLY
jgi:putative membrane protein